MELFLYQVKEEIGIEFGEFLYSHKYDLNLVGGASKSVLYLTTLEKEKKKTLFF